MHRGYFALWRKVEDHPFYKEPREYSKWEAWLDILMQAQHEDAVKYVSIGMNILECHYGESLKSIKTWSNRWNWSRAKVFRYLKLLKKMNQIDFKSETITTRIIVINYESYDPRRNASETQAKRKRNASETQVNTDKNEKNEKNKRIKDYCASDDAPDTSGNDFYITKKKKKLTGKRLSTFELFWGKFNDKRGKAPAADAWLEIEILTDVICEQIFLAAERYAAIRPQLIRDGQTPKMAEGWIRERRWEDEYVTTTESDDERARILRKYCQDDGGLVQQATEG